MSEDYLAQQPIQIWNSARGVWEKPMASLLCEHWELFSEAWQTSGMMRNGQVFALPMPAHLTADSESSSQQQGLPTPKARDAQAEGYEAGLRRATPQVGTIVKGLVDGDPRVTELLRTPSAIEGEGGAIREDVARAKGRMLQVRDQMAQLAQENGLKVPASIQNLPTPTVNDMGRGKTVEAWDEWTEKMKSKHGNGNGHGPSLDIEILRLMPTPNTMEHREIKTPEQIAALKEKLSL